MTKINKRQLLTNVGSSWFSLGFDVLVGLFLSPFLLHWLGDTAFGIWVLIFSITGYYGLFDLGIRSSVVRYVSKFTATDDIEDLAKLINTSLFTYSCIGVLSLLVTCCSLVLRGPHFQDSARISFDRALAAADGGRFGGDRFSAGRGRRIPGWLAALLHQQLGQHRWRHRAAGSDHSGGAPWTGIADHCRNYRASSD
jgi:hypothetical protein